MSNHRLHHDHLKVTDHDGDVLDAIPQVLVPGNTLLLVATHRGKQAASLALDAADAIALADYLYERHRDK